MGINDTKKRQSTDSIEVENLQERERTTRDVWHDSAAALLKILLSTIPVVHVCIPFPVTTATETEHVF